MRLWSLDEARAFLPEAQRMLKEVREAHDRAEDLRQHAEDLCLLHGDVVREPEHPEHIEYTHLRERAGKAQQEAREAWQRLSDAGVQLKALDLGLLDFPTRHGRDIVLLCWHDGEETIDHWHTIREGFRGRKPLPDMDAFAQTR